MPVTYKQAQDEYLQKHGLHNGSTAKVLFGGKTKTGTIYNICNDGIIVRFQDRFRQYRNIKVPVGCIVPPEPKNEINVVAEIEMRRVK